MFADEETTPILPLLCISNQVLFPGETLPMRLYNPHVSGHHGFYRYNNYVTMRDTLKARCSYVCWLVCSSVDFISIETGLSSDCDIC